MRGGVDWPVVRAIFYKDVLASRRSKSVYLPILLVPLALLVVLPALLAFFARFAQTPDLSSLLDRFPGSLSRELAKMPPNRQLIELVLGYLAAPLFLVVPMMVSTALAADALAGEKERRTLESLLHLPIQMKELFLAKIGFAFIPSLVVSWVGFLLYAITVNLIAWPIMRDATELFIGVPDEWAETAMRAYYREGVVSGESGAAALAGLIALMTTDEMKEARDRLGINSGSKVFVLNTEGDTDPVNWKKVVGVS